MTLASESTSGTKHEQKETDNTEPGTQGLVKKFQINLLLKSGRLRLCLYEDRCQVPSSNLKERD